MSNSAELQVVVKAVCEIASGVIALVKDGAKPLEVVVESGKLLKDVVAVVKLHGKELVAEVQSLVTDEAAQAGLLAIIDASFVIADKVLEAKVKETAHQLLPVASSVGELVLYVVKGSPAAITPAPAAVVAAVVAPA